MVLNAQTNCHLTLYKCKYVAFKDWTQRMLSLDCIINSKYTQIYIQPRVLFGHRVGFTNIQNTSDKKTNEIKWMLQNYIIAISIKQ
jgi:hypothetical protein